MPVRLAMALWCAAVVAPLAVAGAQDRPKVRVISCSFGGPPWPLTTQCPDGRFSAAHFADQGAGRVPSPGAGRPVRDLRVTALVALGMLADGQTLRQGPHRESLQRAIRWLYGVQDDHGRFWLQSEPDWILDHAMATYAVCEAARSAPRSAHHRPAASAVGALTEHLRHQRHAGPELLLWAEMCARSAAAYEPLKYEPPTPSGATALRREIERLLPRRLPDDRRDRTALLLLEVLRGTEPPDSEWVAMLAEPLASPDWPTAEDFDDPLSVLYSSLACYRSAGPRALPISAAELSNRLTPIAKSEFTNSVIAGSWEPRGAFGADSGRLGTTAVQFLTLTVYYRYCNLEVAAGR